MTSRTEFTYDLGRDWYATITKTVAGKDVNETIELRNDKTGEQIKLPTESVANLRNILKRVGK